MLFLYWGDGHMEKLTSRSDCSSKFSIKSGVSWGIMSSLLLLSSSFNSGKFVPPKDPIESLNLCSDSLVAELSE